MRYMDEVYPDLDHSENLMGLKLANTHLLIFSGKSKQ